MSLFNILNLFINKHIIYIESNHFSSLQQVLVNVYYMSNSLHNDPSNNTCGEDSQNHFAVSAVFVQFRHNAKRFT